MNEFLLRIFFLISLALALPYSVEAYPKKEYKNCLESATLGLQRKNINTSKKSIRNYCHCALKQIIDAKKDKFESIETCSRKYIL